MSNRTKITAAAVISLIVGISVYFILMDRADEREPDDSFNPDDIVELVNPPDDDYAGKPEEPDYSLNPDDVVDPINLPEDDHTGEPEEPDYGSDPDDIIELTNPPE